MCPSAPPSGTEDSVLDETISRETFVLERLAVLPLCSSFLASLSRLNERNLSRLSPSPSSSSSSPQPSSGLSHLTALIALAERASASHSSSSSGFVLVVMGSYKLRGEQQQEMDDMHIVRRSSYEAREWTRAIIFLVRSVWFEF